MFVPYVSAVPQYYPAIPTPGLPIGLSHTGYGPMHGNHVPYLNPLQPSWGYGPTHPQHAQPMPGYGYRPLAPVGYGLAHAGYGYPQEPGYNPVGYGYHPGYGPMGPVPGYYNPPVQPLQPNWSPVGGQQQQG